MKRESASWFRTQCPHCRTAAVVRDSKELSTLVRRITFACKNAECGHTFAATLTVDTTLSPSAIPDPAVNIPLSPHIRHDVIRHQLDMFGRKEEK